MVVLGNGKFPSRLLWRIKFDKLMFVNPMVLSFTPLVAYLVARLRRSQIYILLNIEEPKPLVWIPTRPNFTKILITRYQDDCNGRCTGVLHRDRQRKEPGYLGHDVESLDGYINCDRSVLLGNTGLIALEICSKMGDEINMLGFNFYQGRNHNLTYGLRVGGHAKELRLVGLELFKKFKSLVVQENKDVRFVHIVEDKLFSSQGVKVREGNYQTKSYSAIA